MKKKRFDYMRLIRLGVYLIYTITVIGCLYAVVNADKMPEIAEPLIVLGISSKPKATPTPEPTPTPKPTATPTPTPTPVSSAEMLVSGSAHVQDIGNIDSTTDIDSGILTLGTTGESKRLEGFVVNFINPTPYSGTLQYRVHVQEIGWMDWVDAGVYAGTEGQEKQIEAVEFCLTGELAKYYSVQYCVHIQDLGEQEWVSDGEQAGTTGESMRVEQIKIQIVPIN